MCRHQGPAAGSKTHSCDGLEDQPETSNIGNIGHLDARWKVYPSTSNTSVYLFLSDVYTLSQRIFTVGKLLTRGKGGPV